MVLLSESLIHWVKNIAQAKALWALDQLWNYSSVVCILYIAFGEKKTFFQTLTSLIMLHPLANLDGYGTPCSGIWVINVFFITILLIIAQQFLIYYINHPCKKVSTWVHWLVRHSVLLSKTHRSFYLFSSIPTERRNVEFKLDV